METDCTESGDPANFCLKITDKSGWFKFKPGQLLEFQIDILGWVSMMYKGKRKEGYMEDNQMKWKPSHLFVFRKVDDSISFPYNTFMWSDTNIEHYGKHGKIRFQAGGKTYQIGVGVIGAKYEEISDYYEYDTYYDDLYHDFEGDLTENDYEHWNDFYDYYFGYLAEMIKYLDEYIKSS